MVAFTFDAPPRIVSKLGASGDVGAIFRDLGCRNVALITDRIVLALRLPDLARASLAALRIEGAVFADVTPDPPEQVLFEAVRQARAAGVDGVCGLGGGSVLDTAKLVAVLLAGDQPLADMYGVDRIGGGRLPLVLVPTTAGTGSEVTPVAIITTGTAQKKGVVSRVLIPDCAVLDATLTERLPRATAAATGIDAIVHAIEAMTSRIRKNPMSDGFARQALRLLGAHIRAACDAPRDTAAREAMLLGSMWAGMAFANAPVAAVHALAYPLGGHFAVPHGVSNAIMLPHVLGFNRDAAAAIYAEIAPLLFPALADQTAGARVEGLIAGLARLAADLGLATRLRDVGVRPENLAMLASDAMEQTRLLVNNPRELRYDDALALYRAAY